MKHKKLIGSIIVVLVLILIGGAAVQTGREVRAEAGYVTAASGRTGVLSKRAGGGFGYDEKAMAEEVGYTMAETAAAEMAMEAPMAMAAYDMDGLSYNSAAAPAAAPAPAPVPQQRKLIRNVNLTIETLQFDPVIAAIQQAVAAAGGYIESSDISSPSGISEDPEAQYFSRKYAFINARIPSDRLDGFLGTVQGTGSVTSRSESVNDVTLQYTDLEAHKTALEREREKLYELMEKAGDTDAVISIMQRITNIEYELDSYGSQLRVYDNRVDYATVTIQVNEVRAYTPKEAETFETRIRKELARAIEYAKESAEDLVIGIVALLPFLAGVLVIVVFILILGAVLGRGRSAEKRAAKRGRKDRRAASGTEEKDAGRADEKDAGRAEEKDAGQADEK